MRVLILAAGAALTLTACGETDSPTDDMNAADNMLVDETAVANDVGGLDANAATNAGEEANLVANDLITNDADTNLANGM